MIILHITTTVASTMLTVQIAASYLQKMLVDKII